MLHSIVGNIALVLSLFFAHLYKKYELYTSENLVVFLDQDGFFSFQNRKVECILPVVISSDFRMGQYREGGFREDATHYNFCWTLLSLNVWFNQWIDLENLNEIPYDSIVTTAETPTSISFLYFNSWKKRCSCDRSI